ncbi:alpha-galactosidase [candidate division KSB1 bacterium]|nr:alpha-galactosidase [candidate division KSB1 bacterium]
MKSIQVQLENGQLTLETGALQRRFIWNNGHLITKSMTDQKSGHNWELGDEQPDLWLPWTATTADPVGKMEVREHPATSAYPARTEVQVDCRLGTVEIRRVFRLYADCPAIACDFYLRGQALPNHEISERVQVVPPGQFVNRPAPTVLERLALKKPHWRLKAIQFWDLTDFRNNLVAAQTYLPYRQRLALGGNLLLLQDVFTPAGLFILKEAPGSEAQLAYPGFDFTCKIGEIQVIGIGLEPNDLRPEIWTRAYGFVTGLAYADEFVLLKALRQYQQQIRRRHQPGDLMLLVNTWGDRNQDRKIKASFAQAEVQAVSRLGGSHFQLDDGWQQGHSPNSAIPGGSFLKIWDQPDYWKIHPQKFPAGFKPIQIQAAQAGVQLGLWFNPSKDRSYADWEKDAAVLIQMYREYGIRVFKIDGVDILDKVGEVNFRALLDRVQAATNHDVIFNLDITNGHRFGFHYFNEYGNLFLENRYTDVPNYYPHWTLRNLWQLAAYVPSQSLQIEFLNKWRNVEKYPAADPLAPGQVPFDYCFAITLVAQPLAWFEASGLPPEAFEIQPLIQAYRALQPKLQAGMIFPIGNEPSGTDWTGFQSILNAAHGYFVIFRELNSAATQRLTVRQLAGKVVKCSRRLGAGRDFTAGVDAANQLEFWLPTQFSFGLFEYEVVGD